MTDRNLRALVWQGLILWCVLVWGLIIGGIAFPAAKALAEAASTRPDACAGLTASDCTARAEGGW